MANDIYIQSIQTAAREVFDMMVRIPLTLGQPHEKNGDTRHLAASATIGVTGDVSGTIVIAFPREVALSVAAALAGCPMTDLNQDCVDALGEVANMIAGSAKSKFPGGHNNLSLPNVTVGNHRVAFPTGVPITVIPCDTPQGTFRIEAGFRQQ